MIDDCLLRLPNFHKNPTLEAMPPPSCFIWEYYYSCRRRMHNGVIYYDFHKKA